MLIVTLQVVLETRKELEPRWLRRFRITNTQSVSKGGKGAANVTENMPTRTYAIRTCCAVAVIRLSIASQPRSKGHVC